MIYEGTFGKANTVTGATMRAEDEIGHFFATTNHHWMLFFTTKGRVYRAKVWQLPESARDAKGSHVAGLLSFQPDEEIAQVLTLRDYQQAPYLLLATKRGLVKKTALTDYDSARQPRRTRRRPRAADGPGPRARSSRRR